MTAEQQKIVDRWNQLADELKLARIIKLTKTREKNLRARMQEPEWSFEALAEKIRESKFLLGGNERGWRVNFDFIINASSYVKILEGRYNNGRRTQGIPAVDGKYEDLAI